VLGRYKWPESQESDFVYSASSIGGSATTGFQADFSSAAGKKALQHFDSQESDPEVPFFFEAPLKTVTTSFLHETFGLCSS
jgi:xanthine dehydrogenase molybdopterin-binding subunit B